MNEPDDENIRALLRRAMPPVADAELKRDLWPRMLRKLDERPVRWSWLDWALLALTAVGLGLFPEVLPALLYHL